MEVKVVLQGRDKYSQVFVDGQYIGGLWNAEAREFGAKSLMYLVSNELSDFFIHAQVVSEKEEQKITELEPEEAEEEMEVYTHPSGRLLARRKKRNK